MELSDTAAATCDASGTALLLMACTADARGVFRVSGTAGYRVWVAAGSPPDTSDPDTATFFPSSTADPDDALPVDGIALTPGAVNYVAAAPVDRWGLQSAVPQVLTFDLDTAGSGSAAPPSVPVFTATAGSAGIITVGVAAYEWMRDQAPSGGGVADQWAIYLKVGSDPAPGPGGDTPVLVSMVQTAYYERLSYPAGPYTAGQVVHVLVRARRSADRVESTNTTCLTATAVGATAAAAGLTLPETMIGNALRQA
jgi:hypothetical protein